MRRCAELQGNAGCVKCHGKGATDMAAACWSCHSDIQRQVDSRRGLHGNLPETVAGACTFCHSEHNGDKIKLISDRSFHAAGVLTPEKFDHNRIVRFNLNQRHDELTCKQCHPAAEVAFLAKDRKRFLGLSQQCESCHKDVHEGTFGGDCLSCHGQSKSFKQADGFIHAKDFPLIGGHAGKKCIDCHDKNGPTSVATLKLKSSPVRACGECHESPHRPQMLATIARQVGKPQAASCTECHGRDDRSFLYPVAQMTAKQHASTGFVLDPPHDKVQCAECHQGIGNRKPLQRSASLQTLFSSFYPPHTQIACGDCHESPHRSAMVQKVSASERTSLAEVCSTCHGTHDLTFLSNTAKMTAANHAATGFVLDMPHDKVEWRAVPQGDRQARASEAGRRPGRAVCAALSGASANRVRVLSCRCTRRAIQEFAHTRQVRFVPRDGAIQAGEL